MRSLTRSLQIRRHVAAWHSRYLFEMSPPEGTQDISGSSNGPSLTTRSIVAKVCTSLLALHSTCQYDSLLLITSGKDSERSYIGGTKVGKAFWESMKMGGTNGVKMFKNHCKSTASDEPVTSMPMSGKKCKNSLKSELNTAMRVALRHASGNSAAEMRWTKPEQIENWGVRISGWPQDLPFRNPSNNTVQVNQRLLELLKSGHIKFVKPGEAEWDAAAVASSAKMAKFASPRGQKSAPAFAIDPEILMQAQAAQAAQAAQQAAVHAAQAQASGIVMDPAQAAALMEVGRMQEHFRPPDAPPTDHYRPQADYRAQVSPAVTGSPAPTGAEPGALKRKRSPEDVQMPQRVPDPPHSPALTAN